MIKAIPMYTVVCDNCGADRFKTRDVQISALWAVSYAISVYGFIVRDGKHYCADCAGAENNTLPARLVEPYDDEA